MSRHERTLPAHMHPAHARTHTAPAGEMGGWPRRSVAAGPTSAPQTARCHHGEAGRPCTAGGRARHGRGAPLSNTMVPGAGSGRRQFWSPSPPTLLTVGFSKSTNGEEVQAPPSASLRGATPLKTHLGRNKAGKEEAHRAAGRPWPALPKEALPPPPPASGGPPGAGGM